MLHALKNRTYDFSPYSVASKMGFPQFAGDAPGNSETSTQKPAPPPVDAYNTPIMDGLLQGNPDKGNYLPLKKSYAELPPDFQKAIDECRNKVTPQQIEHLYQSGYMGLPEELGDMAFEVISLRAVRAVQNPESIKQRGKRLFDLNQKGEKLPFSAFKEEAGKLFNVRKAQALQDATAQGPQETGVAWDASKARDLLNLIVSKFIIFRAGNPKFDMKKETKPLLMGEAKEVNEHLVNHPVCKMKVLGMSFAYTHLPFLPLRWFMNQLTGLAQHVMKLPLTYADLMECAYRKQSGRQDFEYRNLGKHHSNEERKKVLKSVEFLNEGVIVQNRLQLMNQDSARCEKS